MSSARDIINAAAGGLQQAGRFLSTARDLAKAGISISQDYLKAIQTVRSMHGDPQRLVDRYAAASPTRLGQSWRPVTKDINTIVTQQSSIIRARVQQLVRDFPVFARACNIMVNYTVGTGITYQAKVKNPTGKGYNKAINLQLEDAWKYFSEQADPENKQHLNEMGRLAKRQDVEAGEFICVCVQDREPGLYLPISLRFYEADWLTSNGARGENNAPLWDAATGGTPSTGANAIVGGVEYDPRTGRIAAYHLADPNSFKAPVRVPARWVTHGHEVLRPGQKRGISPFVTAVLMAHDLNEMLNAELDASQMAAKWLGFIESPQPGGMQALRTTSTTTHADGSIKKLEEVENAVLEYLRPGEKITFNSPNRPGTNFEPFLKFILRMVAIVTHSSYELLSGDYSGLSYSNLKAIRVDMLEDYDPIINRHIFQFYRPVHRWFMDYLHLTGKVSMPGYEINSAPYMQTLWQPSGHRSIDPLREGKAAIDAMKSLTRSPQEIAQERGRDLEDIIQEIKEAVDICSDVLGADIFQLWGTISTAKANNPAAVAGGETDDSEGQKIGGNILCLKK